MGDPRLERLKQLRETSSPEVQARIDAYLAQQAPQAAPPPMRPTPGLGAPAPVPSPGGVRNRINELVNRPVSKHEAPAEHQWYEEGGFLDKSFGGPARAALSGMDRALTGGLATRAADYIDPGTKARLDKASAEHSGYGLAGTVLAGLSGKGLAGVIGKAASGAAGIKAGQGLAQAIPRGMYAGAAGGAAQSGIEAAVGGEDVGHAMERGTVIGAGLGGLGALVSASGRYMQSKLRDPLSNGKQAQDLALAEKAGARTSTFGGVVPNEGLTGERWQPEYQPLQGGTAQGTKLAGELDELDVAARKSGQGIDALAAQRASGKLGSALDEYHGETVGNAAASNAAGYGTGQTVSSEPILRKNLQLIQEATHPSDGAALPGHVLSGLATELPKNGEFRVLPMTSPEAHAADPDLTMAAGLAKRLGIITGAVKDGDVVIFQPKDMTLKQVDDSARMYDRRVDLETHDPATAPLKALGNAYREARSGFGEKVVQAKAETSAALNEMKNTLEASGLPRELSSVDTGDIGIANKLEQRMRGYKAGGSVTFDNQLDKLRTRSPELGQQMDQSAAVGAIMRLKAQATPHVSDVVGGYGVRPYGLIGSAKLGIDPLMGAFSHMGEYFPGLPAGVAASGSRKLGKRGKP